MILKYFQILLPLVLMVSSSHAEVQNPSIRELWNHKSLPKLMFYHQRSSENCIIICPGGGYGGHAIEPEGHGIARWLNSNGVSAAVLQYRLPKGDYSLPLKDVQKAIQDLRELNQSQQLNFKKIGILGFSAGGHLAASSLTLLPIFERPDFGILIYPVISFGPFGHKGSRKNLLGKSFEDESMISYYSLENQIDSKLPPVFLAHAKDDKPVPPENSQMFYDKAKLAQPKSKLLILDKGGHGLSGYKGPSWDLWQSEALKWIKQLK